MRTIHRNSVKERRRKKAREMGSESESEMIIPCLDFRKSSGVALEEGSEGWKAMSKKVIEACESHGCFLLMCDEITSGLREEMFTGMKTLFDLPEEIKKKHVSPNAYRGYQKKIHVIPLCETFGIDDANLPATAQDFTNLMWPQGNPSFCETLNSMSSIMLDMCFLILKMILEGYGLPQHYISDLVEMKSTCDSRMTRYEVPEDKDSDIAMVPHTDKGSITMICQNGVHGLQVLNNTGEWINVKIPQNGYVVIVADVLKAWSNGRLQAAKHRVVMSGDKDRYAFVLFAVPKEDMIVKVPPELVDDKMHPLRYRPFKYAEYLDYHVSYRKENNALEEFAGL